MVNVIIARNKIDCEHLLGKFVDESHYDVLIEEDTDCYKNFGSSVVDNETDFNELNIAFKFRKNFFSKEQQDRAYLGLKEAASQSQNRGLAAGPKGEKCIQREWVTEFQLQTLDYLSKLHSTLFEENIKEHVNNIRESTANVSSTRGMVWLASEIEKDNFNFEDWLSEIYSKDKNYIITAAKDVVDRYISDTTYANPVFSGIAGWFDRYPRIPYGRATSYTQHNFDKFKLSFPFLQSLNAGFKELLPLRWSKQKEAADKIDSKFLVPETVFTTVTVNKTFRTACHRDAGDFSDGLSNLLTLSNDGRYTGGYLVFPEYRVAVNVRPGDLLLVNNHEIIHGNTPIECEEGSERISLVCYLREKMLELGSYEYENIRYEFVESRRKNPEHPLQRKLWNGVSANMWECEEWYDFLEERGGRNMVSKYHPEAYAEKSSLDSLFG